MKLVLDLPALWPLIEPTGQLLRKALSLVPLADQIQQQCTVALRELMENGVKYSQTDSLHVVVHAEIGGSVEASVENTPVPQHLATLREEIDTLTRAPDSLEHYVGKMRAASQHAGPRSGLGLSRIRHECAMMLTYQITGNKVRVTATHCKP